MTTTTRTFHPAHSGVRCDAVIYRAGWAFGGTARCPQARLVGDDLCLKHRAMADRGEFVQRVQPARVTA